jgi:hypothetical protein
LWSGDKVGDGVKIVHSVTLDGVPFHRDDYSTRERRVSHPLVPTPTNTYAPPRSILVRWGIGAITVNGDTATAVTQETWSNQEAGAVAPGRPPCG